MKLLFSLSQAGPVIGEGFRERGLLERWSLGQRVKGVPLGAKPPIDFVVLFVVEIFQDRDGLGVAADFHVELGQVKPQMAASALAPNHLFADGDDAVMIARLHGIIVSAVERALGGHETGGELSADLAGTADEFLFQAKVRGLGRQGRRGRDE